MLHDNMGISRLMVHAQHVLETRLKRKTRKFKNAKSYDGGTSKGRLKIQDKPRFKKSDSNKVPSNLTRLTRIGYLNIGHKSEDERIHLSRNLHLQNVVRSIRVSD